MAKLIVPLKCSEVSLTWISASQINKQLEKSMKNQFLVKPSISSYCTTRPLED